MTLFDGPGEMRALYRDFDWSSTPLGPADRWPLSLRTTVATLLASRHPMFLWWGPDLVQIFNDAYRPSFGYAGRHLRAIGAKGAEFWTEIWDTIGPQIEQVMAGGESTWHEDQFIPIERNGRLEDVWWTYGYSPAFDDEGRVNGVLVVCQETTGRVRADRELQVLNRKLAVERSRLAHAFEHAPSFLAVVRGRPLVFEMVNQAYRRLVGRGDLEGRVMTDVVPEAREQGFEDLLYNVIDTGEPYVGQAVPILFHRAAGEPPEERLLDFVYFPLVEADGTRSGAIVHGVDVTEHVQARRESDDARAAAESANRAKSEFLAIMSHELRTPLNAIGGYAEILELEVHGPLNENQREDLARIRKSQRHLLGLINDVLNYTRVEAARVSYDIRDEPVYEILTTCEALTAPQLRAKGLSFGLGECPPDLRVHADRERVQQILINLLTNAIKFTEPGGRVLLSCQRENDTAQITVSDTGRGIDTSQLKRIFEPFVQIDARLTRTHEGIGLGLAISRDLARGMGGDLTVDSEPHRGSTFTLTLPAPMREERWAMEEAQKAAVGDRA